jgi:hypothetical protein
MPLVTPKKVEADRVTLVMRVTALIKIFWSCVTSKGARGSMVG